MEFLRHLLLVLHFVGLASLLGGFMVQVSAATKHVNPAMLHGSLTQLVTGVLLVGVDEGIGGGTAPNNAKMGVKLAVLLIILVLLFVHRRRDQLAKPIYFTIGGLTLLNIVVAVFWTGGAS